MTYRCITKRCEFLFLILILCVVVAQWGLANYSFASNDTALPLKNGQSLTELSQNILTFINQNQYELAREELTKLSALYLSNDSHSGKTVEAHKAYAEQIIHVKSELNKHQIDQVVLLDRCLQLYIASEVYEGKDIREFSKRLEAFYQNAVTLRDIVLKGNVKEIQGNVDKVNADFSLLSSAIQIAYPPEYHNQLQSMLQHLNAQTKDADKIKEVVNYLVILLETMNRHAQDVNARLMPTEMQAEHYAIGISAIIATALLVVFRRKWQRVLDY